MGYEAVRIETQRLLLRSLRMEDRDVVFRIFTPAVTRFMSPPSPERPEETEAFLASAVERMGAGTDLVCAVTHKEDDGFLGCVGVHELATDRPELGIWIREEAWGEGYGLEAVAAVHHWASAVVDVAALGYPVDVRNLASRRIAEHLDGVLVEGPTPSFTTDGRTLQIVRYHIPATPLRHITDRLRRYVLDRYGLGALHELEALAAGGIHDGQDAERVLTAILVVADEDLARFDEAVDRARADWRDLLMAAGLGDADWPQCLDALLEGAPDD